MKSIQGRLRGKVAFGVLALVLAACSNSTTPTSSKGAPKSASTAIGIQTVGGMGDVLDTSKGLTLYHLTTESNGKIECTGSCVRIWPPVLVQGAVPAAPAGISGTFGTIKRPDGTTQLTFDGMPLYTYSGDSVAGQANGQGVQGVWFAVTPSGSSSGGGSGGGYGNGSGSGSGGSRGGY
jgi:predicted lipoprotein with Yx(FWY)xxD motif